MAFNSKESLDDLIKKIYKSYIEIKAGDFKEIDRDMLLSDISNLYSSVKALYPSSEANIAEIELDQIRENTSIKTTSTTDVVEEPITDNSAIEDSSSELKLKTEESNDEIDLSIFSDGDMFEDVNEDSTVTVKDIKPDNTNSPAIQDILGTFSKSKKDTTLKTEDNKEQPIEKDPLFEKDSGLEVELENSESEKKSANKIMDFLKHDDSEEKKDIYSYLDINTRIGLVEKFFKGNSLELTECLVKVNALTDKSECIAVIDKYAKTFEIKDTDDIYQQFLNLVDRKFQNNY